MERRNNSVVIYPDNATKASVELSAAKIAIYANSAVTFRHNGITSIITLIEASEKYPTTYRQSEIHKNR